MNRRAALATIGGAVVATAAVAVLPPVGPALLASLAAASPEDGVKAPSGGRGPLPTRGRQAFSGAMQARYDAAMSTARVGVHAALVGWRDADEPGVDGLDLALAEVRDAVLAADPELGPTVLRDTVAVFLWYFHGGA